jgi:wyosine [tRNA(Phe)-imidazoG37] synthetase (radical SAM superfamily)
MADVPTEDTRSARLSERTSRVLGPVPSRRLGRSLGVNSVPFKTCSYSCVYCQLGPTTDLSVERSLFYETQNILDEVRSALSAPGAKADYVTFLGSGEPTLASNMGEIMHGLKRFWTGGTALLTSGALLWRPDVRGEAEVFDVVMPTVSAGTERLFRRIHRPHPSLSFDKVHSGMRAFSKDYSGRLWAEVMLLKGLNDDTESLEGIRAAIETLQPEEVHLMAPVRPPCEKWVEVPTRASIERALDMLPGAIDMTEPEAGEFDALMNDAAETLLGTVRVHPLRQQQALEILVGRGLSPQDAQGMLEELVWSSRVERLEHRGEVFYRARR